MKWKSSRCREGMGILKVCMKRKLSGDDDTKIRPIGDDHLDIFEDGNTKWKVYLLGLWLREEEEGVNKMKHTQ